MKRICCFLTAASLVFLVCCKSLPSPAASEIADKVISLKNDSSGFTAADDNTVNAVFGCEPSDYDDYFVSYSNEAGSADIVAVFKTDDKSLKEKTHTMLSDFLQKRLDDFKGYAPLEVKKIEETEIISIGDYEILIISSDFKAAKSAVDSLFER